MDNLVLASILVFIFMVISYVLLVYTAILLRQAENRYKEIKGSSGGMGVGSLTSWFPKGMLLIFVSIALLWDDTQGYMLAGVCFLFLITFAILRLENIKAYKEKGELLLLRNREVVHTIENIKAGEVGQIEKYTLNGVTFAKAKMLEDVFVKTATEVLVYGYNFEGGYYLIGNKPLYELSPEYLGGLIAKMSRVKTMGEGI